MKKLFYVFSIFAAALAGCSFSNPAAVLKDNVRTVKIETFANKTVLYGLEDKLYQKINDKLLEDGRLIPANENPDSRLIGEITKYELIPLSFDAKSVVEQYKLWMQVNIRFTDINTGNVITEENDIPADIRFYPPGSTQSGAIIETEQSAQDRAVDELASEIVYQILRYK